MRKIKALLIVVGIIVVLVGWNIYDTNHIDISECILYSTKLPADLDKYKIAFISDYHDAYYYEQAAEKIKGQNPDVILFGGDMVTLGENTYDNTISLIKELKDVAPIYMVTGNHEAFNGDLPNIIKDFKQLGVKFLDNQSVKLYKDGSYINLYGMSDPAIQDKDVWSSDKLEVSLEKARNGVDNGVYNILLMHRANLFEKVYNLDYDAIFAGHLHGGLIRLPFVGGVISPERDMWFPPYTKGMYFMGKSKMIVSAGMDKMKSKPRFFNGPEIVIIELHKG